MHVRSICLQKFMSHDAVEIAVPERGIVLVTGRNGLGKSSLFIESIAAACWGRTMRGTPPWRDEEGSTAIVTTEVEVERKRAGKKPAVLTWHRPGERATRYDTPSKSQDALSGIVGSFDIWRRTSVFSSADAAHFSLASDKDRKLLLENILGLERFDVALKACREELREVGAKIKTFESQAAVLDERLRGIAQRLQDLLETETTETAVVGEPIPADKLARMRKVHAEITTRRKQLESESRMLEREVMRSESEARAAKQHCDRLDHDACPTCAQPIPETQRKTLRAGVTAAQLAAQRMRDDVHTRARALSDEIESLDEERRELEVFFAKAEGVARDYAQLEKNRKARADKQRLLEHQLEETTGERDKAKERYMLMCHEYDELEVCEQVLGLKGIRAHMLGDAMQAITDLSNRWLRRLFPGTSVLLHEEGDKVVLEIHGLAHGYGYAASSSGQRRRIDIALLLALSDLEAASRGKPPGTLFLDEVADSLDEEGIQSFSDVLTDLAATRAVVLISHNPDLYESLPYAARVVVEEGRVRTL